MSQEELEFLKRRRSIRHFKPEPIQPEQLKAMEDAAVLAASAMNEQAWFFAVIQREDVIEQLEELADSEGAFYGAKTVIVLFGQDDAISPETDTILAASNMMNAAVAVNLGTCFIYLAKKLFNDPRYSQLKAACGVPEGYTCYGSLAVGIPDQEIPKPSKRRYDVFSYIR